MRRIFHSFMWMLASPFLLSAAHVPDEILIKWANPPASSTWTVPGSGATIVKVKSVGTSGLELWRVAGQKPVETVLPYAAAQADQTRKRLAVSGPAAQAAALFGSDPAVLSYATNDYRYLLGRVPNDPLVASQYHLDMIRAFAGWEFDIGNSTPTTIAIIDTGVAIDHVDLSSASGKIWINPVDVPGGGDQDGNGRTDDFWGWDFADNDNNPADCLGHGTLVASAAGAATDNGTGAAGVSWGAKILPLKIFSAFGCNSASTADIIAAIDYAVWVSTAHRSYTGRTVINLSLGCPGSDACGAPCPPNNLEEDAMARALANNVPVIAAKGNCGNSVAVIPSDYAGVFGVGATNRTDSLASFSSIGSGVDLVAPGVDILGANRNGGFGNNGDDGTSFSAPIVAGAAALIFSVLPAATTTQVFNILTGGADDLGSAGRDDQFGHGRLNLLKSMRLARYGTLSGFDATTQAIALPNPFKAGDNRRATFSVPDDVVGPNIKVQVYDVSGSLIRELESASWDGKNENGFLVASGVYIFEVKTDKGSARGRVIVDAGE
ncbi:MAG: S8 family peptidase [Elusimicrobia bacterium]|nr:S8 family peptidase [Elusimicrobiota bacterium]